MTQELPLADELAAVFARMSGLLLSQETVGTALELVTSLAKETIPGAAGVGVTLLDERGRRVTAAVTDPLVERADAVQYELDEGPCLMAWTNREVVRVDDALTDDRWPRWAEAVVPLGPRASLTAPLLVAGEAMGALKVYAEQPGQFGERDEFLLTMFATQAATLLANVQSLENAQRLSDGLKDAMRSRDLIGMAKGILMARERADEETAFAMLVSTSQREHKKLRDVASALVQSAARGRH